MGDRLSRIALVCGGAALVVVGCSASPPMVDKDEVAAEISDRLEKKVGRAPDSVSCPEDLRAEVGVTQRCELTRGPDTYGVTLTVTKVQGSKVEFDLEVDDKPS
ncbi:hypothetical protein C731_2305 [Mycolicibacterium hassiacum DSM 44199]|uniref:DUF4333 domain-containing protein n=1 Tax=Mycolicibacterium hassiacum (strain DSM 44199 / CIP 105218 / JCM 12690 / 3849) TaxID=1122247 RepID=K5BG37_MYCHD|nr:hypothetical protein C731_2305 [Mycolicibacterium hassiacum DSM 44199]MDA4088696.1 hypothetical protein [Mycolicibacterium hassiacum DSM 44199]